MRGRLATVLRVAELQEQVARGAAGATRTAVESARRSEQAAAALLAGSPLEAGPLGAVAGAVELRRLRALALTAARAAVEAAERERAAAVARWQEAQRRQRLFEELAVRERARADATREKDAQRLADDLSAARARQSGDRR